MVVNDINEIQFSEEPSIFNLEDRGFSPSLQPTVPVKPRFISYCSREVREELLEEYGVLTEDERCPAE